MEIVWEDPPASNKGGGVRRLLFEFAAELRKNPGRWARYPNGTGKSIATRIRQGKSSVFAPAGSFEAVTRDVDGKRVIYVRYVGESR